MGIESLNQKSLDNFNKDLSVQDIEFAIKKIGSHGINVHGLFLFGDDEFKKGDGLKGAWIKGRRICQETKTIRRIDSAPDTFPRHKVARKIKRRRPAFA